MCRFPAKRAIANARLSRVLSPCDPQPTFKKVIAPLAWLLSHKSKQQPLLKGSRHTCLRINCYFPELGCGLTVDYSSKAQLSPTHPLLLCETQQRQQHSPVQSAAGWACMCVSGHISLSKVSSRPRG